MGAQVPHVVIVGGGFAGLNAARRLRKAPVRVTLIDRRNHHVFQPLLYQVASAALSPAQIAAPIRHVLSRQRNAQVLLGEVKAIDTRLREVVLTDDRVSYDYLIIAAGVSHSYFGHEAWAPMAPGLKTIDDALEIRRRFLLAFEAAERESDAGARAATLTFVVVGGGPTGVELAGAMIEIARRSIPRDFRSVDTAAARVVLVEGQDRVLAAFPESCSTRALRDLVELGVEVILNARVVGIDAGGVEVLRAGAEKPDRIEAGNVVWAAGVRASPIAESLGVPLDRSGRVIVGQDLSIPGHSEVFVCGDLATVTMAGAPHPVPGVAPAAVQMGNHAARIIMAELAELASHGTPDPVHRPAFRYVNKGELATIGRAKAVGVMGFGLGWKLSGMACWLFWGAVHVVYLIGFRNRLITMIDWIWSYFFFARGARLITGNSTLTIRKPAEALGEVGGTATPAAADAA